MEVDARAGRNPYVSYDPAALRVKMRAKLGASDASFNASNGAGKKEALWDMVWW